jgi:hypothetical protein
MANSPTNPSLKSIPPLERTTPWIGSADNRVAVRISTQGEIEIAADMSVAPHATQSIVIDYLPDFERRMREHFRGKPLLTVADVSARLNVGESWVRRHAQALGAVSLGDGRGNDLRFVPDAIEAFIAKRRLK